MKWRYIIEQIPEEQLDYDVSVYDLTCDEYYPVEDVDFSESGLLDDGRIFLGFRS